MAHHDDHAAPMDLHQLLAGAPPAADVVEAVAHLVAVKARTREMGRAPVPAPVARFVHRAARPQRPAPAWAPHGARGARRPPPRRGAAAFRTMLERHAPPAVDP